MKKLSLVVAVLGFVVASCCGNKTETPASAPETKEVKECPMKDKDKCCAGMTEEQKKECTEFKAKWDNWANLTDAEKKELIAKKKAFFDERKAKMDEMEAKMKEVKAEMEAQLAKWDKLTLDEQKAFFDKAESHCGKQGKCPMQKEEPKK